MAGTIVEKEQLENYQGPSQQPQQHQHQQPTTFPTQPTMWWQQQRAYIHNVAIVTIVDNDLAARLLARVFVYGVVFHTEHFQ